MARHSDSLTATSDVVGVGSAGARASAADGWASWTALLSEAQGTWWQLQADLLQQQCRWWTALLQGRLPLAQAFDIAEAEAEHAANPFTASPWSLPAQEAARYALAATLAPWSAWAGWSRRFLPTICGPAR